MMDTTIGPLIHAFLVDHLAVQKGLRRSSIQSYRDAMRLFLCFVAKDKRCRITVLSIGDLTFERVLAFLRDLEESRHNQVRTRNQRLAALQCFFDYLATRAPELVAVCQRVAAIDGKRARLRPIRYLEQDEVTRLFAHLRPRGSRGQRDHALLLFLYNTGARAQEVADLRVGDVDFGPPPRVRLHGKGDKWRTCPLWAETANAMKELLGDACGARPADAPFFRGVRDRPLTRFGVYKLVRRHAAWLDRPDGHVTPHVFRHTTAVHLLASGVDVNVIRGWLGHVNIATTNRYAEINMRTKEAALAACTPPLGAASPQQRGRWRSDEKFLEWLNSL